MHWSCQQMALMTMWVYHCILCTVLFRRLRKHPLQCVFLGRDFTLPPNAPCVEPFQWINMHAITHHWLWAVPSLQLRLHTWCFIYHKREVFPWLFSLRLTNSQTHFPCVEPIILWSPEAAVVECSACGVILVWSGDRIDGLRGNRYTHLLFHEVVTHRTWLGTDSDLMILLI